MRSKQENETLANMQWTVTFLSIQHTSTDVGGSWAVSGAPLLESLLVEISAHNFSYVWEEINLSLL